MIPWSATDDNVLDASVKLVTCDDSGQHIQAGRSLLLTDGERHGDIVARMAQLARARISVIQVQRAYDNPVEHPRTGYGLAVDRSDDGALSIAAEGLKGAQSTFESQF